MKPTEYDFRIIEIVSAYRGLLRQKQANLAQALNVTQPEYCRIEKGERALTLGNLNSVCSFLRIPVLHIISLADITLKLDIPNTPLPVLLIKTYALADHCNLKSEFGRLECEYILSHIKSSPRITPVIQGSNAQ